MSRPAIHACIIIFRVFDKLIAAFESGDLETAAALQQQAVELIEAIAATGYLGTAKAVMGWQGVPVGPARLPVANPSRSQLDALREKLETPVLQA